jgi:Glycosyl transferase family 2
METLSPTFSIVIEWENARLSELGRTREMLRRLHEQLEEVGGRGRAEIIFLHDKDHVERRLIETVVAEVADLDAWPARIRIFPTEGLEYFEQKNFGARQSDSNLIIFLDSDVVPEQGWLAGLLDAFRDPEVQVVCGNTYVSMEGLYDKAFALFWFFPLRMEEDGLVRTSEHLWGNNSAFRREVFESCEYPHRLSFRGQGAALKKALRERGIDIFLQPQARVSHPAPNGLRHFVNRALCQGYDLAVDHARAKTPAAVFLTSLMVYLGYLARSLRKISRHHQEVRLGPAGAGAAFGIAVCYYTLSLAGTLLTLVRPDVVRSRFSI